MTPVRQEVRRNPLPAADIAQIVEEEWRRFGLAEQVASGQEIALLVGSRGIASLTEVVTATAAALTALGAAPFVVPAMGSHGGATAEGQLAVLASLGVTEATIGCPVRSTMETVEVGATAAGLPVQLDRIAAAADGIIVINRVKPHTHFRGPVESGLCKMLALGAGNHSQAKAIHAFGSLGLAANVQDFSAVILAKAPVVAGLALLEDGGHALTLIEAVAGDAVRRREAELLEVARGYLTRLPLEEIDVLIVDRIGKEISGTGMDSNVTGRIGALDLASFETPQVGCIVVLDLSEETHGNATGVGLAEIVTARLDQKIDWPVTYANSLTAQSPRLAARPIVAPDDRAAIETALTLLGGPPRSGGQRIVRIADTLHLDRLWLSDAALAACPPGTVNVSGERVALTFTEEGTLAPLELA